MKWIKFRHVDDFVGLTGILSYHGECVEIVADILLEEIKPAAAHQFLSDT